MVDTGVDVAQPELAGRIAGTYDVVSKRSSVADRVGHGTFVAGLIGALDGNGIGGKGVAGNTRIMVVRASRSESTTVGRIARAIEVAVRRGARIINMSLSGPSFSVSQLRALQLAFYNDVLPVAAAGNNGLNGNPLEFPAAALGGRRGERGIGLSVTATRPGGHPAGFSTHNAYVSLAAPGAGCDRLRARRVLDPAGESRPATGTTRSPARASSPRTACASPTGRARASRRRSRPASPRWSGRCSRG